MKRRVCLRCSKTFSSRSVSNRICPTCYQRPEYSAAICRRSTPSTVQADVRPGKVRG